MKIGIVILNWNGLELLKTYLPSVVTFSKEHVIYLADNASADDSIKWTQNNYPMVKIIPMDKNRGYAGGYNVALKSVDEEFICLLNSDVEVTPNWCDIIIQRFKNEPNLGACQPKLLDHKNRQYFEYAGAAGGFIDNYAYPYCRGRVFNTIEKDHGQYDDVVDIHWASGASLFLRKSAFNKVNGFDEDYFAHQEEIDLCWRMRHAGYTISYEPRSVIYHLGGGTLNSLSPQKTFYNFRNSLYNIVKNDRSNYWILKLFVRMVLDGVAGIKFLFELKGIHFVAILRAHFDFYFHIHSLIQKRRFVKSFVKVKNLKNADLSIVNQYFIRRIKYYKS